ncbi:MAG TPA: flagellar motor protein PomA [Halieaceae bacterium]|jgi:chemotaxis protein MotA|uniref:Flagellar motor protein PomA n=1 Tax=Haliea salexigens TaxID=287487 RepID=A0A3C1KJG3_9GAMM|nr:MULTISPECIES: flagellar motor protein PomA [Haliea]HAN26860.1 flagellar motor protein PomA [Haliea salexigens]HBM83216.1 flagellar motor protein PomA [Halieaceae bacterium]MAY91392.1 flagellar motor protein PomA [Haliea sp.]MBK41074.1 flagellar motor protein PomA [Haliea sp.]MBP71094.1 flagellar motor protein PomA [Haliea sp.]|tara:strand:- start:36961 stop:37725 length:765 start_codon:yes stop_codon:yes gene_type:complete
MDLATLLGLVGAMGVVMAAIITGGSPIIFMNVPSILIVLGGTALVVMMKFTLGQFFGAFKVAARAFMFKLDEPEDLITQVVELATIARKEGMLALENAEINNEFLRDGVRMLIDGNNREVVSAVMSKDLQQTIDRHKWGSKVFSATGDVAPAMGMIGTLIGLVQMLSSMDDPKSIGPAMAVALLTTLYGAVLANMVAIPIADKLDLRKAQEGRIKAMCIDGVLAIQEGQNPRIIESMLKAYLEPKERNKEAEAA